MGFSQCEGCRFGFTYWASLSGNYLSASLDSGNPNFLVMDQPLHQAFRNASRKQHRISDSLVAARLLITATDKRRWATALTAFWHILASIEKALHSHMSSAGSAQESLAKLLAQVKRTGALEADLRSFYGSNWRSKVAQPSPAVVTYLERIQMLVAGSPHLLLAHAYTQHMAFLAGGPILRRSVRGSLQLGPDDPGTASFEFQVPTIQLQKEYKRILDGLGELGEQKTKELIEEHRLVFELNNEVIREFPVTPVSAATAIVKLLPPEALLLLVSALLALFLVLYTWQWVIVYPDAADFADPDALIS